MIHPRLAVYDDDNYDDDYDDDDDDDDDDACVMMKWWYNIIIYKEFVNPLRPSDAYICISKLGESKACDGLQSCMINNRETVYVMRHLVIPPEQLIRNYLGVCARYILAPYPHCTWLLILAIANAAPSYKFIQIENSMR